MSISRDEIDEFFELFPEAAPKLEAYSVRQMEHLSKVRQMKDHLHEGNFMRQTSHQKN